MTKIASVVAEINLPPSQRKILDFLKEHPDEVFAINEEQQISQVLGMNRNNIGWSLWALEKRGLIGKRKVSRKVYYGSHEAIGKLDKSLSSDKQQLRGHELSTIGT